MTHLPRTIRLDPSDTVIFTTAAEPGDWAVPGTFLFAGVPLLGMGRKEQVAFRSGFLGIGSWGFSTLAIVVEARPDERAAAVADLARAFVERLGAPDLATALPAAEEEMELAEDLCRGQMVGTLIALHRTEDGGTIRERYRTLKPRAQTAFGAPHLSGHDRAFEFFETDEEGSFDLVGLAGKGGK